jgi:hypothetical protein
MSSPITGIATPSTLHSKDSKDPRAPTQKYVLTPTFYHSKSICYMLFSLSHLCVCLENWWMIIWVWRGMKKKSNVFGSQYSVSSKFYLFWPTHSLSLSLILNFNICTLSFLTNFIDICGNINKLKNPVVYELAMSCVAEVVDIFLSAEKRIPLQGFFYHFESFKSLSCYSLLFVHLLNYSLIIRLLNCWIVPLIHSLSLSLSHTLTHFFSDEPRRLPLIEIFLPWLIQACYSPP